MKMLLWSLIVGLASSWTAGALAAAGEEAEEAKVKAKRWVTADGQVVVLDDEESGEQVQVVIKALGEDEEGVARTMVLSGVGSGETSDETGRTIFVAGSGDREPMSLVITGEEVDENAGWLGVQIAVPEPAEEDEVAAEGIIILNVIEDSPAEASGFQKDDLIIEVDDAKVGGDLESFVSTIREAGVDARVKFTVLRDGERRTLVSTLGSRAQMKPLKWVFETSPHAILKDSLRTRAKVLLRGEDDEWVFEDLPDLESLPGLPGHILKLLPKSEGKTVEIFVNDGGTTISTQVTKNGDCIAVERTGDGAITVTRFSQGSDEKTVENYEDEEALAAGDPEAYEIYQGASAHVIIGSGEDMPTISFDVEVEDIDTKVEDALRELNVELKGLEDIDEHLQDALRGFDIKIKGGGEDKLHRLFFGAGKATRTIHENADGSIDVIIRKGDDELVTHYTDVDDLVDRSPEDYEAYLDLQATEDRE